MASILPPGGELRRISDTLENGRYVLQLRPNGNLAVLEDWNRVVWQTNTATEDWRLRPEKAKLWDDGNFELIRIENNHVWATNTSGYRNARLRLYADGNLALEHTGPDGEPKYPWWTLYRPSPQPRVTVPDVRESQLGWAILHTRDADLREETWGDCSGRPHEPWVKSQDPKGGEKVASKTRVRLECSSRLPD